MKNNVINQYAGFSEIIHIVYKHIQCSRYEQMIIKLAKAYEGYQFYLPAFLDFRGRIYRCGVLHFHEHNLARSLVLFAEEKSKYLDNKEISNIYAATGFLYKPFVSEDKAITFLNIFVNQFHSIHMDFLLKVAYEAKRPFQFISNIMYNNRDLANYPITQDASASAYQIMSYFLLDESMAMRTNLRPENGKI